MTNQVEQNFAAFYESWIAQLEDLLELVNRAADELEPESAHKKAVAQLIAHYRAFNTKKQDTAQNDVLAILSPTWLSSLEIANLWMTGWKPCVAFRLVKSLRTANQPGSSLIGMTSEQVAKIEKLRLWIMKEEYQVEKEMVSQQMVMADHDIVEVLKWKRNVRAGLNRGITVEQAQTMVDARMRGVLYGLEQIMKTADRLRIKTLEVILEVLTTVQGAEFMGANAIMQLRMRKFGRIMNERRVSNEVGNTST